MDHNKGNIIVLGMHRSGTSALSGLISNMGAYFGPEERQVPVNESNPKGFWERWDVVYANDDLLAIHDQEWHRLSQYKPDQFDGISREDFGEELCSIIEDYQQHQPWFVKDPRLCLTLPAWLPSLENPVCVFVLRDPLQIALSLESRGDCSPQVGLALWEVYTASALRHTRNLPRHFIRYQDLLNNPQGELQKLQSFFENNGVTGTHVPSESEIKAWLDKDLRREQVCVEDYPDFMNSGQQQLNEMLCDGSILRPDAGEWTLSRGGEAALRSYEAQHLCMVNQLTDLGREVGALELEIDIVRGFKADMLTWNADLDTCVNALENSATWKIGRAITNLWFNITGRKRPTSPFDRMRDIIEAQGHLQGLGEPEVPMDGNQDKENFQ